MWEVISEVNMRSNLRSISVEQVLNSVKQVLNSVNQGLNSVKHGLKVVELQSNGRANLPELK